MATSQRFIDALVSSDRAHELAGVDNLFGFLIGSWDIEAILHEPDGRTRKTPGEVHASWVLEGRAIQDLFIFPRRSGRASEAPGPDDRYATTIRTYDRRQGAWRVDFINPAAPDTSAQLIARRKGETIEMEGQLSNRSPIRWRYRSVTSTSFEYSAEIHDTEGWRTYLEISGTRSAS